MSERIDTPLTNEHFAAFCLSMLGQPLEPDFFSKVLSVPMASSTPCPPDVQAYPFAPPMQSAQTFLLEMS